MTSPRLEPVYHASGSKEDAKGHKGADMARKEDNNREAEKEPSPKEEEPSQSAVLPGPRESPYPPSNFLERGIIYFFFRSRVGIDQPRSVDDIRCSYIILRPLEQDTRIGRGTRHAGNSRLLILPKKILPTSGRDRFMVFVEKARVSFTQLKQDFLPGEDYETKTVGKRHMPAATPMGEGVYAITTTGKESHLAYFLTLPDELDEFQREVGLKEKGSFILSTKNPKYPGPANARLPKRPEYPKEYVEAPETSQFALIKHTNKLSRMLEEFHSLRWVPTDPKHLDYVNAQFLLIGKSSGVQRAMARDKEKAGREEADEDLGEMVKLEDEDTKRMRDLADKDSTAIFADLQALTRDYPRLQTIF